MKTSTRETLTSIIFGLMFAIIIVVGVVALGGCTVDGNQGRFQRTGFPGIFDPGATVILDTTTNKVYVGFSGSYAEAALDGAVSGALIRPSDINVSGTSSSDAWSLSGSSSSSSSQQHNHGNPGRGRGPQDD